MKQLIIENQLPIPIFVRITSKETDDDFTIVAELSFEMPDEATESDTREVKSMQQYTSDLSEETTFVELDPGTIAEHADIGAYEDEEVIFVRLTNLRQGTN